MMNQDARTLNYTGCGNTVNAAAPAALRIILASLRYWVQQMHVDGFRFDLAATLGRRGAQFDREAPFFQAIANDPVLSRVKMIAEPWDLGPHGYQVGGFPAPWRELNGRYRDRARCFWKGDAHAAAPFAKVFCGSDEIFGSTGRPPHASVNFITSHDGFTLRDVWTYNQKHNEANGEENRDGDNHNHSWNCGIEGEEANAAVRTMRRDLTRATLATIFCSQGVPFLTMGDERWRTQQGNNNAYCQDNALSWMDWTESHESSTQLDFTQKLIRFRREHPELRRSRHFSGGNNPLSGRRDIDWMDELGEPMNHHKWHDPSRKFFAAVLDLAGRGAMLLAFNATAETVELPLPKGAWRPKFDTSVEDGFHKEGKPASRAKTFPCAPHSVACLMLGGDHV
jgi:glycogen operon protein